jgi:hypothetical protein
MSPRGSRDSKDRTFTLVADRGISARDLEDRRRERAQREASDTRSEIQKLMGEPPPAQSALAHRSSAAPPQRSSASHFRFNLWKRKHTSRN